MYMSQNTTQGEAGRVYYEKWQELDGGVTSDD